MQSITTSDSKSVTVVYEVNNAVPTSSVELLIARSSSSQYVASSAETLATMSLSGGDLSLGTHTVNVAVSGGLGIDPSHPYVLAVADPNGTLEGGTSGNTASFRTFVIGAVVDGYEATGQDAPWVAQLSNTLKGDGYDATIPFSWAATSNQPQPGETADAAARLADLILADVTALSPGTSDVVDLHLIGFDRGAVVASQTLSDLQQSEPSNLQSGWTRLTLLDPISDNANASYVPPGSLGPLGVLAEYGVSWFRSQVDDPPIAISSSVDQSEIYFQQSSSARSSALTDRIENPVAPLSQIVVQGGSAPTYDDVTRLTRGHQSVPVFFLNTVAPTLGNPHSTGGASKNPPSFPKYWPFRAVDVAGTRLNRRLLSEQIANRGLANAVFNGFATIKRNIPGLAPNPPGFRAVGAPANLQVTVGEIRSLSQLIASNMGTNGAIPSQLGVDLLTILGQDLSALTGTAPPPVAGVPQPHSRGYDLSNKTIQTDQGDITPANPNNIPSSLPSSVDLQSAFNGVYDQGPLNSCVDNAIAGAVQYILATSSNPSIQALAAAGYDPSRLFLFYGGRFVNANSGSFNATNNAPTNIAQTIQLAERQGIPTGPTPLPNYGNASWPYNPANYAVNPGPAVASAAAYVHITGATSLIPNFPAGTSPTVAANTTISLMQQALAGGSPFIFGITAYAGFDDATAQNPYLTPTGGVTGGHAMLAVGYDNNYTVPGYSPGAFLIRNSWGSSWGLNGYAWMPYSFMATAQAAYTLNGLSVTTTPAPALGSLGSPSANAPVNTNTGEVVIDTQAPTTTGRAVTFNFTSGNFSSSGTNFVTPLIFTVNPTSHTYTLTGVGASMPATPGQPEEFPYDPIMGSDAIVSPSSNTSTYTVFGSFDGVVTTNFNANNQVVVTGITPNSGSIATIPPSTAGGLWLASGSTGGIQLGEVFSTDASNSSAMPLSEVAHGYSEQLIIQPA